MDTQEMRKHLHDYVHNASPELVAALYSLLSEHITSSRIIYDDATVQMLESIFDKMISGEEQTFTLAETFERMKSRRGTN